MLSRPILSPYWIIIRWYCITDVAHCHIIDWLLRHCYVIETHTLTPLYYYAISWWPLLIAITDHIGWLRQPLATRLANIAITIHILRPLRHYCRSQSLLSPALFNDIAAAITSHMPHCHIDNTLLALLHITYTLAITAVLILPLIRCHWYCHYATLADELDWPAAIGCHCHAITPLATLADSCFRYAIIRWRYATLIGISATLMSLRHTPACWSYAIDTPWCQPAAMALPLRHYAAASILLLHDKAGWYATDAAVISPADYLGAAMPLRCYAINISLAFHFHDIAALLSLLMPLRWY